MSSEAVIAQEARNMLRNIGYGFVQREPRLSGASNVQPDLIAWATNHAGELVPWAAVEFKSKKKSLELTLPVLARSRDLLGTQEHYAVVDGQWFKADRGVRSLEPVEGPTQPPYGHGGFLKDEELATGLLSAQLWRTADRDAPIIPDEILYDTNIPGIYVADDEFVPVDYDVLRRARRRAIVDRLVGGRSTGVYASKPVIATAIAELVGELLGGTVLDPFCGTGSFLWALLDRALDLEEPVKFVGYEHNLMIAQAANVISRGEPVLTTIEVADAYHADLPDAQVVVTAPPLGLRLQEPHPMLDGGATTDGEAAAVDLSLRSLQLGGRAVFHLSTAFTFKTNLERYRQYLANEFHVAALIGLPEGAVPGTSVRSVLLVVDRTETGETFIAQLGEDWETQLGEHGAALEAARAHLLGRDRGMSGEQ